MKDDRVPVSDILFYFGKVTILFIIKFRQLNFDFSSQKGYL